ncbi:glycogen synthase GlgA [Paenibacillus zeisoli]|uniref:Glycogen synthase n=1 Tax=Paenibacillus zeisoli TaxID=2496267 RepID=A0A433XPA0_9BACL|nr:glycogen synthase GlgA [Paenibacillus zeisoli]RUT35913.1 glycogen synthase GlgA [Paenibacillus zeisoli]
MKILFAAAEAIPFVKTGGLADVIGALPKALLKAGHDVRIVLPKYKAVPDQFRSQLEPVDIIQVPLAWRSQYCGIEELTYEGIPVYFIDNEFYYGRDGIYGYGDDGERFAFFNRAVLEILPYIDFQPDVIHCHDWHAALIPVLLRHHYLHNPFYQSVRTVFTVHNLLYQGIFPYEVMPDLLDLPNDYFTPDGLEYYGNVNYLKAGLVYADHVTTVSPTYAEEIKTEYYGYGLDGLLRSLGGKLSGIVNGIDTKLYNPATDTEIPAKYRTSLNKKRENKPFLQQELGLPVDPKIPLISMVTRLVDSKGLELVRRVLDELLYFDNIQVVVLGTGEYEYEQWFKEAANRHPSKLSAQIKFNDGLSRRIYAGSDIFLMPSKFEPCGISQLLALRYGSIPVVRETGGLNDTVQSFNEFTGEGNGFSFNHYNAHDMLYTLRRAVHMYHQPDQWKKIVRNAFAGDYSWNVSAERYLEIYQSLLN